MSAAPAIPTLAPPTLAALVQLAQQPITPEMPLVLAGQIWLARLETAGLDALDLEFAHDQHDAARQEDQRHHSRQTINSYRTALELFLRWLERQARTTVATLTLDDLLLYVRVLRSRSYNLSHRAAAQTTPAAPLAARSIHSYTRPLLGFLTLIESYGALTFTTSVARTELARILPRLPEPVAPTPPDLRRVVAYFDHPPLDGDRTARLRLIRLRNAALLHLLFSSAARISEALGLNIGDICRDQHILSRAPVYSKGRRQGVIFVRRSAEQALAAYLEAREYPPAASPLFEAYDRRTAGTRLSRSSGWRIVREAAEMVAQRMVLEGKHDEAELLRQTSPHTFRHFVGYHLLNEGVDLAEVSQILRHRSVEVTRSYYARYRDIQLQEVHDQFSADPLPFA